MNLESSFKLKASKIYNNKYDYSLVVYNHSKNKVQIICPIHGIFEQRPNDHLMGHGCPKCGYEGVSIFRRMSLSTFITKANKRHNNTYDYSYVTYTNSKIKVKIRCPDHGVFEQSPNAHLRDSGCPKCGVEQANNKKRYTLESFKEKASLIHHNRYDYSLSVYHNSSTKLKIICPFHGIFEQRHCNHLKGEGCPTCANKNFIPPNKLSTIKFIEKAIHKHNNRYDYSLVQYIDSTKPVKIICPAHGIYEQTPNTHLSGGGCPSCAVILRSDMCRDTKNEFIRKAVKKHGNKYDYSKVTYRSALSKVHIICERHGMFLQTPGSHLYGQGCPRCIESHGERFIAVFLESLGVLYEREKHFCGCEFKRKLLFDFYIPSKNMCIEYDGLQHFKPVKYFGGDRSFKKLKKYDSIKNDYCRDNGINLIRISYKDNIQNVLCSIVKPSMQV